MKDSCEFEDFLEYVCRSILMWKDHPKNSKGRSNVELIDYQNIWSWFYNTISTIENSDEELSEVEQDFVNMTKFTGDLYRYHIEYDTNHPFYGIVESQHRVSWTKSDTPSVFYWTYEGVKYLQIKAITTERHYGVDLVGFSHFIQKHVFPKYRLGSPAILKEQEVVFPLLKSLIKEIKIVTR